jgi:DNA adenine methylase
MRPPMPYYGGKMRIAAQIADLLPPHRHYVEPFAGSLAVLLAKSPSPMETANDIDQRLVTFWRVLRDRGEELIRVCALTPHSRAEYAASAALDVEDELETARRVWVKLTQSRSATFRSTGWRYYIDPAGCSSSMPGYLSGYVDRFAPALARLHAVSLECRLASEVIDAYGRFDDVCLYVDPPYLGELRAPNYAHKMGAAAEHRALLEQLLGCRAAVVLSGYACVPYDEALTGWTRVEIPTFNGNARGDGARTEVVWVNRDVGDPTLDLEVG